jgi:hypothetical protein
MISKTLQVCFLAQFLMLASPSFAQQNLVADLDAISQVIEQAVNVKMPGWKHRRGEPIGGSKGVLVESYSSKDATIKLSVIPYASSEEAASRMKDFAAKGDVSEKLSDLGDEGCAWGYRGSKFAFRRRNLNIFVSIEADDMDKEKVSKQFAKLVADAIKDLAK